MEQDSAVQMKIVIMRISAGVLILSSESEIEVLSPTIDHLRAFEMLADTSGRFIWFLDEVLEYLAK